MGTASRGVVVICASVAVMLGCGDEGDVSARSSGEQWSALSSGSGDSELNRAPRIESIRFEPEVPRRGQRLQASVAAVDDDGDRIDLGFSWSVDDRRIPSDDASITVPSNLARGAQISVEVVASDKQSTSKVARHTVQLPNRPPRLRELGVQVVEGEGADLGEWVADPIAEDLDGDEVSFRAEWRHEGGNVIGDGMRLSRNDRKRGERIVLTVWPSDGESEGAPVESAPLVVGNSPPNIVSRPPPLDASGRFRYAVRATDRDGDRGFRYALAAGPERMSIDPFSGQVMWEATAADAGEHRVQIEVDDRHGGVARQTFFVAVEAEPRIYRGPAAPAPRD